MISHALHPSIFEQPAFMDFFNNLLEHFFYFVAAFYMHGKSVRGELVEP
jgi:hypothetical protein